MRADHAVLVLAHGQVEHAAGAFLVVNVARSLQLELLHLERVLSNKGSINKKKNEQIRSDGGRTAPRTAT